MGVHVYSTPWVSISALRMTVSPFGTHTDNRTLDVKKVRDRYYLRRHSHERPINHTSPLIYQASIVFRASSPDGISNPILSYSICSVASATAFSLPQICSSVLFLANLSSGICLPVHTYLRKLRAGRFASNISSISSSVRFLISGR